MSYFITFTCYGTRLHGDETGSVDRLHNLPGSCLLEADESRASASKARMDQAPYQLDVHRRELVLQAMGEACSHRGWMLFAAHVRTDHVHAVVGAGVRPEIVMNCFKSYASRALNRSVSTRRIASAGRAMVVRDISGKRKIYRLRFLTSFTSRVSRCTFLTRPLLEAREALKKS